MSYEQLQGDISHKEQSLTTWDNMIYGCCFILYFFQQECVLKDINNFEKNTSEKNFFLESFLTLLTPIAQQGSIYKSDNQFMDIFLDQLLLYWSNAFSFCRDVFCFWHMNLMTIAEKIPFYFLPMNEIHSLIFGDDFFCVPFPLLWLADLGTDHNKIWPKKLQTIYCKTCFFKWKMITFGSTNY